MTEIDMAFWFKILPLWTNKRFYTQIKQAILNSQNSYSFVSGSVLKFSSLSILYYECQYTKSLNLTKLCKKHILLWFCWNLDDLHEIIKNKLW